METFALHEDAIKFRQELEELDVFSKPIREFHYRRFDALRLEMRQKLQYAVATSCNLETLNEN